MYVETSAQIYAGFMGLFSIVVIALHLYGIARVGLNRNFHFDISRHAKVPRSTRGRGYMSTLIAWIFFSFLTLLGVWVFLGVRV